MYLTPYELIKAEETLFQTQSVKVADNYDWNFYKHCLTTLLYKNSIFLTGKSDDKPFKNITLPLLRLRYHTEGFDLKDIVLFVNEAKNYYKSFFVRKWHDKWARKNKIDNFIDGVVESFVDYGGALVKNAEPPEVVPFQRLAFCDQTDILGGPICEKHYYTIDQMMEMKGKWDADKVDEAITNCEAQKNVGANTTQTLGKYVEVYELHGTFPEEWLTDERVDPRDFEYVKQLHIITFYKDAKGGTSGLTLFRGKEPEQVYKFLPNEPIYGRALGMGGAEELFEAQVWTNYDMIRITEMLDQASKVLYQTTDKKFANKNQTRYLDNGEILVLDEGKTIGQIDNFPRNLTIFNDSINRWEDHAQQLASASTILGEQPPSGTPFKLQQLISNQARDPHIYRKGKIAEFLREIYEDWFIPTIAKEANRGQIWLAELDMDELKSISEKVMNTLVNEAMVNVILSGRNPEPGEAEALAESFKLEFSKDKKKFLEIFKNEFKEDKVDVEVIVAGKQKDMAGMVDKLNNVFATIAANPAILQNPGMSKIFNEILEASGMSSVSYSALEQPVPVQPTQPQLTPA